MTLCRWINLGCVLLSLGLGLGGCQHSPRKQYFVLTAAPVEAAGDSGSQAQGRSIGVGPVEIAEYLNRSQMLFLAEDGSLQGVGNSYWGEPLEQGIARVIALNLSRRDPSRTLVGFPWRADDSPGYSLRLKVLDLNRDGDHARLDVSWELQDKRQSAPVQRHHFVATTEAAAGATGLVRAYSLLLARLSEQMDAALRGLP